MGAGASSLATVRRYVYRGSEVQKAAAGPPVEQCDAKLPEVAGWKQELDALQEHPTLLMEERFEALRSPGCGCRIGRAEHRAITLPQLCALRAYMQGYDFVSRSGEPLGTESVNLYDVVTHIVKPATALAKVSYVELVATGPQHPRWFVSHWWGEPVLQFVQCLSQHSADRGLSAESPYWVCAYANNQWNVQGEVGDDPRSSAFHAALQQVDGTVSVLDEKRVCFTRVWCGYEIFVSLDAPPFPGFLYDIYTMAGQTAVGLADGYNYADMKRANCRQIDKNTREAGFPIQTVVDALSTKIQDAKASVEADRRHILNVIVDAPLNDQPPERHQLYDRLNRLLAGRFAAASWRNAVVTGIPLGGLQNSLAVSGLDNFAVSFHGYPIANRANLPALTPALPYQTLKRLELDLSCTQEGDAAVCELLEKLQEAPLARFHLSLLHADRCTGASTRALARLLAARRGTLRRLKLDPANASTDSDIEALAEAMPSELTHLELCLAFADKVTGAGVRALCAKLPPNLEFLSFRKLQGAGDARALADRLQTDPARSRLAFLDLDYWGCKALGDAGLMYLAERIPCGLRVLKLQLHDTATTDVGLVVAAEAIGKPLRCGLVQLELSLDASEAITDETLKALASSIGSIPPGARTFKHLHIGLNRTRASFEGVKALVESFPEGLDYFDMQICMNQLSDAEWDMLALEMLPGCNKRANGSNCEFSWGTQDRFDYGCTF
uniref:Uncharacterized protein n=1 Tax=Zooxanthella nutricula TaxID=1333877 RepID=A0A7S2HEF6_9DINO